jgi:hypothetical protein
MLAIDRGLFVEGPALGVAKCLRALTPPLTCLPASLPAGSPVLRTVPAFAGLSSCHWHDEFACGEPAAHPRSGRGEGRSRRGFRQSPAALSAPFSAQPEDPCHE